MDVDRRNDRVIGASLGSSHSAAILSKRFLSQHRIRVPKVDRLLSIIDQVAVSLRPGGRARMVSWAVAAPAMHTCPRQCPA